MSNIDKMIDTFVTGDYFIIFLVFTLIILVVLIMALIQSREEYNELLNVEKNKHDSVNDNINNGVSAKETDLMQELSSLMASDKDDVIDENKPLIKQIDTSLIKTSIKVYPGPLISHHF